jgi:hypothetical protein
VTAVTELVPFVYPMAFRDSARLLARGDFPTTSVVVGGPFSVLLFANTPNGVSITPGGDERCNDRLASHQLAVCCCELVSRRCESGAMRSDVFLRG